MNEPLTSGPRGDELLRAFELYGHELPQAACREQAIQAWNHRAQNELWASTAFAWLAQRLPLHGADENVQLLAAQGVADELAHAQLCQQVAACYAAAEQPWPRTTQVGGTSWPDVLPEIETDLNVIGLCCIHESINTAYLTLCLAHCTHELPRIALRTLLSDDVDHSRIGWAHLANLGEARRQALMPMLPKLLDSIMADWRVSLRGWPPTGDSEHGLVAADELRHLVRDTVQSLVLPGFAHVGMDAGPVRNWLWTEPPPAE